MIWPKVIIYFRKLWNIRKGNVNDGISMGLRLFVFMSFFLLAIMMGFLLILQATGTFSTGVKESRIWMENELSHLSQGVSTEFGKVAVQGVSLSRRLSASIENKLKEQGVKISDFHAHPLVLEDLLNSEIDNLAAALEKTKSSGVFIILDATVNPSLENSEYSRAGIFLKNMEPNIISEEAPTIRFLRGPSTIARQHHLDLLPQWKMEFDTQNSTFFRTTIEATKNHELPLSRLYYWSPPVTLIDNNEPGMMLCVPLIGEDGTVFGICGFEISNMLFKLSYTPDNSIYSRVFCALAPIENDSISISQALFAGNYSVTSQLSGENLNIHYGDRTFNAYQSEQMPAMGGLHQMISLYPTDSPFIQDEWIVTIMLPDSDLSQLVSSRNVQLFIWFSMLMMLSLIVAAFISSKYIKPVLHALNQVKSINPSAIPKTNILEIDDLLEFLTAQDEKEDLEARAKAKPSPLQKLASAAKLVPDFSAYELFVRNIESLSNAEKAVFNLYMLSHTANEIADILCLSINTIKTHNKRIYMKLGVSSRKELMVYVQMMQNRKSNDCMVESE